MTDLMHFAMKVPSVPAERRLSLGAVVAARAQCAARPPWTAIFAKAYAMVAQEFPELRQVYLPFPRPHLYEYQASVATVTVLREFAGEPILFGCIIEDPATLPVTEVAKKILQTAQAPLDQIADFRRAKWGGRLPLPLRRLLMWLVLNIAAQRAKYFGTFAITVVPGADTHHPLSVWTTVLTYGPLSGDGSVVVRMIIDHRVLDGGVCARVLARLEEILNGPIVQELTS